MLIRRRPVGLLLSLGVLLAVSGCSGMSQPSMVGVWEVPPDKLDNDHFHWQIHRIVFLPAGECHLRSEKGTYTINDDGKTVAIIFPLIHVGGGGTRSLNETALLTDPDTMTFNKLTYRRISSDPKSTVDNYENDRRRFQK